MSTGQDMSFRFGRVSGLQFEFAGESETESAHPDGMACGRLAVWLGEDLIWGRLGETGQVVGVEWYWIELLEHLAMHWPYLRFEQGYPFGLMPFQPSGLTVELRRRWSQSGIDEVAEDDVVYGFRSAHNLALALNGCVVPDIWFVREGAAMLIEAKSHVRRCPRDQELETLEAVGEHLCRLVRASGETRSTDAIAQWRLRDTLRFEKVAPLISGASEQQLSKIADGEPLQDFFRDPLAGRLEENRPLELVYRCKGLAPAVTLRRLIHDIPADLGPNNGLLVQLSRELHLELQSMIAAGFPPYSQGRKLALALRHNRDLFRDRSERAEPERLLELLGVKVEKRVLDSGSLDAVAVWGCGARPWIVLNEHEKHTSNIGAERATLSHELCHLLVDRQDVLPIAAVVGGVMDRMAEQRANAFAAEFLCPRFYLRAAYDQFMSAGAVIDRATQDLGVSKELAALQLARSDCQLSSSDQREIESYVAPYASLPWRSA